MRTATCMALIAGLSEETEKREGGYRTQLEITMS